MRILSKFRDYYDGIQRHGADEELVCLRRTEPVDRKRFRLVPHPSKREIFALHKSSWTYKAEGKILCFAGKGYPLIRVEGGGRRRSIGGMARIGCQGRRSSTSGVGTQTPRWQHSRGTTETV